MTAGKIRDIVILGAGNLASNLGPALLKKGFRILQVYDRSATEGKRLAVRLKAEYSGLNGTVRPGADLYVLAVSDDAIAEACERIDPGEGIVIHVSGTRDASVLKKITKRSGVIYPVQTFSRSRRTGFRDVPLCVESDDPGTLETLLDFAGQLSGRIYNVTGSQRKMIHVAAVFANNFPTFMVAVADRLMKDHNLDPGILQPLIRKTVSNLKVQDPFKYQTGPAMREDMTVIGEHMELLKSYPAFEEIYKLITDNIIQYKKTR